MHVPYLQYINLFNALLERKTLQLLIHVFVNDDNKRDINHLLEASNSTKSKYI